MAAAGHPGVPEIYTWESLSTFGRFPAGVKTVPGEVLFPRLELTGEGGAPVRQATKKDKPKPQENDSNKQEADNLITIEEFARIDLRVARITRAERIEGADKLLRLKVDLGSEERQVVAGIARHYLPEQLVGKSVLFVANLKPVKLRGILSEGMLLAASDAEGRLVLTCTAEEVAPGSKVS
jgi:methionyl-tRNA synthetase